MSEQFQNIQSSFPNRENMMNKQANQKVEANIMHGNPFALLLSDKFKLLTNLLIGIADWQI